MEDGSSTNPSRRQILTTAALTGAASVAGCSSLVDDAGVGNSGATDVVVHSLASTPKALPLTISGPNAESPHTSRTLELAPGDVIDPVNGSKLPSNTSEYTIKMTAEDGSRETFEWADPTAELAPLWGQVDDTQNIRFLLQAG